MPLTSRGDVFVVPTPGHTPGHVSVVVEGEVSVFIAGDTSYTEDLLRAGVVDGVSPDENAARKTMARIRELAAERPLVYLPSHDPAAAERLAHMRTLARPVRSCAVDGPAHHTSQVSSDRALWAARSELFARARQLTGALRSSAEQGRYSYGRNMNRPSIVTSAALPVFAILLLGRAVSTQEPPNQSAAALKNPVAATPESIARARGPTTPTAAAATATGPRVPSKPAS